ncbi:MAG: helix-turn-helix transcriptional regulator [Acutalibacteraceae bacterium]
MHETMGQIIKRLRKERGLTQESLAERLGVTFQAVSKWETDAGMPDVSQIVPLANAFGVRTDVLFGLEGRDEGGEVQEIIRSAYRLIDGPDDRDGLLRCYQALLEGLKRYPCQPALLLQALEAGASLAYPENVCYDGENGRRIYLECVKHASLVIRYARSAADVLRAHMLLVLLHAAYGNSEAAEEHAEQFPVRGYDRLCDAGCPCAFSERPPRGKRRPAAGPCVSDGGSARWDCGARRLLCRAGAERRRMAYPVRRLGLAGRGVSG